MEQEKNMRELVEAYQKSGMGRERFATSQGLKLGKLKYWIEKIRKEKASRPSFIQLKPIVASPSPDLVEIDYPNGVKIKVPTANFSFLSQLIRIY